MNYGERRMEEVGQPARQFGLDDVARGPLPALAQHQVGVLQRVAQPAHQFRQAFAGVLHAHQRHEDAQDLVRALEDALHRDALTLQGHSRLPLRVCVCALSAYHDARVSEVELVGVVLHVAETAVDLQALAGGVPHGLRAEYFDHGRLHGAVRRLVRVQHSCETRQNIYICKNESTVNIIF